MLNVLYILEALRHNYMPGLLPGWTRKDTEQLPSFFRLQVEMLNVLYILMKRSGVIICQDFATIEFRFPRTVGRFWCDFHACSTIPEEKWGLLVVYFRRKFCLTYLIKPSLKFWSSCQSPFLTLAAILTFSRNLLSVYYGMSKVEMPDGLWPLCGLWPSWATCNFFFFNF